MSDFAFDQIRYLTSKRSVDDRALNRTVWQAFTEAVARAAGDHLRIVEVGAGTGSMLERLIEWRWFAELPPGCAAVTLDLLDSDGPALERARRHVPAVTEGNGWSCAEIADGWRLTQGSRCLEVRFLVEDVRELLVAPDGGRYDVLLANAFLDLFDLPSFVPPLLQTLAPGGVCYLTMNYDGETIFEPVADRSLEDSVRATYNRAMDERTIAGQPSGDSTAGRHLFHVVTGSGAEVLEIGSSDWVVVPRSGNAYADDEEYFLRCILWFVEQALRADAQLPAASIEHWVRERTRQLQARELVYIAHQIDLVGRRPA